MEKNSRDGAAGTSQNEVMRIQKFTTLAAALFALSVTALAVTALADDTHDIVVAPKGMSLSTKAGWHVNKEYPWKLISGDRKLDKTHFSFTETTASIADAPPGPAKIKGAVCSGDQCRTFEEAVVIP
jgi:hypothetical protein